MFYNTNLYRNYNIFFLSTTVVIILYNSLIFLELTRKIYIFKKFLSLVF